MKLDRKIELIYNSAERLKGAIRLKRTPEWWRWMLKEAWVNLQRSWELFSVLWERKE